VEGKILADALGVFNPGVNLCAFLQEWIDPKYLNLLIKMHFSCYYWVGQVLGRRDHLLSLTLLV